MLCGSPRQHSRCTWRAQPPLCMPMSSPHSCTSMGRGCPEGAGEGQPLVSNSLPPLTPGPSLVCALRLPCGEPAGARGASHQRQTHLFEGKPAPGGRLPVNARGVGGAATRIRESESPGATKMRKKLIPARSFVWRNRLAFREPAGCAGASNTRHRFFSRKLIPAPAAAPILALTSPLTARAQARWAFRER